MILSPATCSNEVCVNIASENLNELLTALKNELGNILNWMMIKMFGYQQIVMYG